MVGRPRVVATVEEREELRALARSTRRDEADRARAVLLSLEGWTSERLGEAFGVTADSVRHWRGWFAAGGVAALAAHPAPGPAPTKAVRALAVVAELLTAPVADRPNWTLSRLQQEIERRSAVRISTSRLSVVMRKKGASRGGGPATA